MPACALGPVFPFLSNSVCSKNLCRFLGPDSEMNLNFHSLRSPTRLEERRAPGCPSSLCLLWAVQGCGAPRPRFLLTITWTWFPLPVCAHPRSQVPPPVCVGSYLQRPDPLSLPERTHPHGSKYWPSPQELSFVCLFLLNIFLLLACQHLPFTRSQLGREGFASVLSTSSKELSLTPVPPEPHALLQEPLPPWPFSVHCVRAPRHS